MKRRHTLAVKKVSGEALSLDVHATATASAQADA
jgi:hypothetical protein